MFDIKNDNWPTFPIGHRSSVEDRSNPEHHYNTRNKGWCTDQNWFEPYAYADNVQQDKTMTDEDDANTDEDEDMPHTAPSDVGTDQDHVDADKDVDMADQDRIATDKVDAHDTPYTPCPVEAHLTASVNPNTPTTIERFPRTHNQDLNSIGRDWSLFRLAGVVRHGCCSRIDKLCRLCTIASQVVAKIHGEWEWEGQRGLTEAECGPAETLPRLSQQIQEIRKLVEAGDKPWHVEELKDQFNKAGCLSKIKELRHLGHWMEEENWLAK